MKAILWDESAVQSLRALHPSVAQRIAAKVRAVSAGKTSGDVSRLRGSPYYRLRVGDYRIIFGIDADGMRIVKIGHRKDIYDKSF